MFKFDKKTSILYSKIRMLKIRKFKERDSKRLKEIAPKAFMVYARFGIDKTLPREKTKENYRKEVAGYIKKFLNKEKDFTILVAEENKITVGYIVLKINPSLTEIYGFKWGIIVSLAVDPEYQGRGIGPELVKKGLIWMKKNGVKYVEVGTDQNNIAAIRTYEKNGFRVIYSGITLSQYL